MKKNQLIKKLQKIPGNPEIILSSDAEGNWFSDLYEINSDCYWNGSISDLAYKEELEDVKNKNQYKKCVVLWPS